MRYWHSAIAAAALAVTAAGQPASVAAQSQNLPKTILCHTAKAAPYSVVRQRSITGIDTDQIVEVGRRTGIQFDFAEMQIGDLEQELLKGAQSSVVCAFAFTKTQAREPGLEFTHVALHQTSLNFFVKTDVAANYKNSSSLRGKTFGAVRGTVLPSGLAKQVAAGQIKREDFEDEEKAFQKLLTNQIDAVLTDAEVGSLLLRERRMTGVTIVEPAMLKGPAYLVFPKGKVPDVIIPMVDDALRKMASDGTIKAIQLRYR